MKLHHLAGVGLAALLAIGSVQVAAIADARHDARLEKKAAGAAKAASKAIAKKRWDKAIVAAESAVALAPDDAGYRTILGSAYLRAGRFASAETAYRDALTLRPDDGRVALNLALAQIATGDWAAARRTLDSHAAIIPVGDRGLATALAGDPTGAIAILNPAARTPGSGAKIRQNLALAYALAGDWSMARIAAAADMSAADVDARIEQWAAFAQPRAASDQVASLLGVTPAVDSGRPVALALNAPVPVTPVQDTPVQTAAAPVAEAPAPIAAAPTPTPLLAKVAFAPHKEVVQPLPTMLIRADAAPAKLALAGNGAKRIVQVVPAATPYVAPGGDWYVQLGAFSNVAVAKAGWDSATRRFAALSGHKPTGMTVAARQGSLYRLSVGGFTRDAADQMCRSYRAKGGACFVRRDAGDRMAQWLRTPMQVASR